MSLETQEYIISTLDFTSVSGFVFAIIFNVQNKKLTTCLSKIQKMETIDEITTAFYELIESISNALDQQKNEKYDKLLDSVCRLIEQKYSNPDLSLENVADASHISPAYLGHLFKKYKLVSFIDYMNNPRIEKARELIVASDLPISTVMEKTGFLSRSHFYASFKKAFGITPSQLRQNKAAKLASDIVPENGQ